jgi:Flp pilus assembly protein TadG
MRPRRSTEAESRKRGISKDGSAFVEFVFVAPLFLLLIFGIIEFSRVMLMYHHVGNAAREGSRYAIVHGSAIDGSAKDSTADETQVQNYVRSISPLDVNNVFVTTKWLNGDKKPGSPVEVTVKYNFKFLLPFMPVAGIPLTSKSQMVISY